jgi:hypothetical protein
MPEAKHVTMRTAAALTPTIFLIFKNILGSWEFTRKGHFDEMIAADAGVERSTSGKGEPHSLADADAPYERGSP